MALPIKMPLTKASWAAPGWNGRTSPGAVRAEGEARAALMARRDEEPRLIMLRLKETSPRRRRRPTHLWVSIKKRGKNKKMLEMKVTPVNLLKAQGRKSDTISCCFAEVVGPAGDGQYA